MVEFSIKYIKKNEIYTFLQSLLLSIRGRIFLFFSIIILFLLISLSIVLVKIHSTETYAAEIIESELPLYNAFFDLNKQMFQLTSALRGWMLTKDPMFKVTRARGWKDIEKLVTDIDLLVKDQTHHEYLEAWQKIKLILPEFKIAQNKVENTANLEEARKILITECIPRVNKMLNLLEGELNPDGQRVGGILNSQYNRLHNGTQEIIHSMHTIRITEYLFLIICLLVSIGVAFLISRQIINPIKTAITIAKRIAAGERDVVIQNPLNDEIGVLLTALRDMQAAIKDGEEHLLQTVHKLQRATDVASETQKIARLGFWEWDINRKKFILSEELLCLLELESKASDFTYDDFLNLIHPDDRKMVEHKIETSIKDNTTYNVDYRIVKPDGATLYIHGQGRNVYDGKGHPTNVYGILQDITERKLAEENLILLSDQLLKAARGASVADIATSVLHNIGNVVNSINVNVSDINDKVQNSEIANLPNFLNILHQHQDNLGTFIMNDKQGQHIPKYLDTLCNILITDRNHMMTATSELEKNIHHITEIIAKQQILSTAVGSYDEVYLPDLLEDALSLNKTAYERAEIDIILDVKPTDKINIDKIKLLQIIVNLVKNSIESLLESKSSTKQLILRAQGKDDSSFIIQVSDNGLGIAPENFTKIFSSGFTTKITGHGFGLYASIISAREMGGSLSAESKGRGKGATFTLTLPCQPTAKLK